MVASPPALTTVTIDTVISAGRERLCVQVACSDSAERRRVIQSFRQTFDIHGRRYARVACRYWTLPLYRRERLRQWLSTIDVHVIWPDEGFTE